MKFIGIGMIIGLANIIPGVSGGTLAVILGVYDRIIAMTKKGGLKKDWQFLLKLIIGVIISILLCSVVFSFLFDNYKIAPSLVFFGIILGSLPMIYNISIEYCPKEKGKRKIPAAAIAAFAVCFGIMLLLVVLKLLGISAEPQLSFSPLFISLLFLSGILAAVSMVLPGISGSLMLVIIGMYPLVIGMLADLMDFVSYGTAEFWQSLLLLLPFGLGCLVGLIGGLNMVRKLLEKQPTIMYFAILGLVAGSLFTVWPFDTFRICGELFVGLVLAAAAAIGTYLMSKSEA